MRRFFAKNILFVVLLNLLVKPVWVFLIDRTVQNRVGHDYGSYQALLNLGIIFQIFLDFGINSYTSKTIAENPSGIKKLFPALLTTRLLLSFLYVALLFGVAFWLGYKGGELHLLIGVSLIQLLNSTVLFIRGNLSGLHQFKLDGLLSISDKLLMIVVCGVLLIFYKNDFKITWFVWTQVICFGVTALLGLLLLKWVAGVPIQFSSKVDHIVFHIRKSLPFATVVFLMSVYTRADMLMVERMGGALGKQEASIYAAAFRLLDVGNMIGLMFAGMLLPIFGGMIARKENMQELIRLCVNILLPVSFLVTVIAAFFNQEIMQILNPNLPQSKGWVFAFLMAAFPALSISNVYSTLLAANGNLKLMNKIALVGVLISLGINFILIPHYHAVGAAITACVTQAAVALGYLFFAKKELTLKEDFRWVFSFFYYIVLLVFIGLVLTRLPIPWVVQLFIMGFAGFAMIFLLRFVTIKQIGKLLQKA
jgi:O-antigen/teichoic acid export membrane protein